LRFEGNSDGHQQQSGKASFPEGDTAFLAAGLAPRRKVSQMPKIARRLRGMGGKPISAPAPPNFEMLAPKIGVERVRKKSSGE
jgi:hypothetical protein